MALRAANAWAKDAAGSSPAKVGKGIFVICQNPSRIIVFIRLALLAHGDKQQASAAKKTWTRIRPTLRDEGTVVTFLK
jgi:hypothetical protein